VKRRRPFWVRRLLPAFAALLVLNLIALAAWTLPQGYKQRNAAEQVKLARQELAEARRSAAQLRDRASAIRSNSADVGRFYSKLAGSETAELVPTLEAVEAMARAPGLKPGGRGVSRADVRGTRLEQVSVTLPLEGSYAQLVRFLHEVETSPRFLTIDSVSMRMSAQRGASLQVQLSAYMQAAPGTSRRRGGHARG
jgi:Tfp pilus assembly protein PilO